jgi:hypothetical protein
VFADLQNVFDLGMVAALCEREGLAARIGWDLGAFAPEGEYHVAVVQAPATVDSVLNHRVYRGRDIVVQVAGGVRADIRTAVHDKDLRKEAAALASIPHTAKARNLPAGRWWWDASK